MICPIIDPVPVELIEAELTPDHLLRKTNKADNEIYVVDCARLLSALRAEAPAKSVT